MISTFQARLFGASILAGAATLAAAAPAFAQQATPPSATAPAVGERPGSTNTSESGQDKSPAAPGANGEDGAAVQEVVVTGTRIRRSELTSSQPIEVIGGQYITDKGFTNAAQAINQLPGIAGSITPLGDQGTFATGRNYANLFNLGPNRTLTLVNGRRFVSNSPSTNANSATTNGLSFAPGTQVDLNDIPTAFIDRIETVQAGGSAIYGSDAVAGVINIITKSKVEGVEVDGQYGRSDRNDFPEYRTRIAFGTDFLGGRGNIAAAFEWNKTSALLQSQRQITNNRYQFATNPLNVTATDGIPSTALISNRTVPEITNNGIPLTANAAVQTAPIRITDSLGRLVPAQFALGGTLVPYDPGIQYSASVAAGGQGFSLADVIALNSPYERYLVGGLGSFEITPHVRLKGEFNYSYLDANEPANQPVYNTTLFAAPQNNLALNANTNPFLSAAARQTILNQLPATANGTFYLSRASQDLVGSNNAVFTTSNSYRGVLAVEGDFALLGRDFNWNVFYNHGQSEGVFSSLQINQEKFTYAVNAVAGASGQAVCAPLPGTATAANIANYQGCSPLNLFGNGAPSPAALAYVQANFATAYLNVQDNAEANLSGSIYKLPAGDLAFNVGYEWRREEAKFKPDLNSRLGLGRSVAVAPASGSFETKEVYFEINLPIFGRDFSFPLLRGLELNFSDREIDNSLAGEGRAYSYQAKYMPFRDLLIRGTRSRSFRTPSITELFLPTSTQNQFSSPDPCDSRFINAGANPRARQANCAAAFQALGAGANLGNFIAISNGATIQVTTGGNSNLKPEIAEQFSYGFVYQPHFIPNLAISADLTNIDLTSAISNFNLTAILSTCYDNSTFPTTVCSLFSRGPNGQLNAGAQTTYVNAGFIHFQGLSIQASYDFAPSSLSAFQGLPGRIGINVQAFNNQRYESSVSGLGFDQIRGAGALNLAFIPRWTGKLDLSYTNGGFRGVVTSRYVSTVRYNNTFTIENQSQLALDDYINFDATMSYKWKNYTARFGVNNVFDVAPPFPSTNVQYDLIGRYYFAGINVKL